MKQIIKMALIVMIITFTSVNAQDANKNNDKNYLQNLNLSLVNNSNTNIILLKNYEPFSLKIAPQTGEAIFKFDIFKNEKINLNIRIDEIYFNNSFKTDKKISLTIKINLFQ